MVVERLRDRSVTDRPTFEEGAWGNFILWMGSIADDIQPWGGGSGNFKVRDKQLRQFWIREPILASALYTITIRDAAFSWTIKGDQPRTVKATQDMLHQANLGKGWLDFALKWRLDYLTQDNGAFFEVIRQSEVETSPCLGINHLDAGRCRRTGVDDWPIIYTDRKGKDHKMLPHQVVATSDFPSPIETANGVGLCAVSRMLRMAQLMRDIGIRDRERASGMDSKLLHIIGGVGKQALEQVLEGHKAQQIEQGYQRYSKPIIFTALDPDKPPTVATLDLAPNPEQFTGASYDTVMKWYITLLAMGLGVDYQDLAPLPSRGIGGSQQSLILHQKSKGKGPELFMKTIEHVFNFHGIIPKNVHFEYSEKDIADEIEQAELQKTNAETWKLHVQSRVLTPQSVRNILLDQGLISQEIFDQESAGQPDVTDEVVARDDEPAEKPETKPVTKPLPKEPVPEVPAQAKAVETRRRVGKFDQRERLKWEREMGQDMGKALRKIFNDLKKRILGTKALGLFATHQQEFTAQKQEDIAGLPESQLFWREMFGPTMVEAMAPNARKIALGAAEFNLGLGLPVNMEAVNLEVLDFSRTYMTEWLSKLETTTRDGLRKAIVTWQETGLGERGLPDLIDSIKPMFNDARAANIAATETTRVFDQGNKIAHLNAGVEFEQWQTAMDNDVRDEHQALQGHVFPINEGPRPSDYINCRCDRVPVVNGRAITG